MESLTVGRAIAVVATWDDLSPMRRRDLVSALNTAAKLIGSPIEQIVLSPVALRASLLIQSSAAVGVGQARMQNIISSLRAVLRRIGVIDPADETLSDAWATLLSKLSSRKRAGVVGFARFCSAEGTEASDASDETLERFERWMIERTLQRSPKKTVCVTRTAWNRACGTVPGWPSFRFARLRERGQYILPLNAFPDAFAADLDSFGKRLAGTPLDDPFDTENEDDAGDELTRSCPPRPLRPVSVAVRQSHCRWAASALVSTGVPAADIDQLACLITPIERVREILRFVYHRAGDKPSAGGSHIAEALRIIAKYHVRSPELDLSKIKKWSRPVRLAYSGMTQKNETAVRHAMQPAREAKLRALPLALMQAARALRPAEPRAAAALAMRALAIQILSRLPLRLGNLIALRLDQHLQRADPPRGRISWVEIPMTEVKNSRPIRMPVSADTADMIEEWVRDFRPAIASIACTYLFPGTGIGNRPVTPQSMRHAIKEVLRRHVGAVLTPYQFRHLAAHLMLAEYPGCYEMVRQLLGHATIATTVNAYCGLESQAAIKCFDDIIVSRSAGGRKRPAVVPRATTRAGPSAAGSR